MSPARQSKAAVKGYSQHQQIKILRAYFSKAMDQGLPFTASALVFLGRGIVPYKNIYQHSNKQNQYSIKKEGSAETVIVNDVGDKGRAEDSRQPRATGADAQRHAALIPKPAGHKDGQRIHGGKGICSPQHGHGETVQVIITAACHNKEAQSTAYHSHGHTHTQGEKPKISCYQQHAAEGGNGPQRHQEGGLGIAKPMKFYKIGQINGEGRRAYAYAAHNHKTADTY